MQSAQERERAVGIQYYVSDTTGIGGRLRDRPTEFRVRELEGIDPEPIDSDLDAYPYLIVRARLRNWDTNTFARELSNRLGMSRERIDWAGTKDRRAVTTQLFSIDDITPEELPAMDGVDFDIVGRFGRGLFFGDLVGNDFSVTVRDVSNPGNVDAITADLTEFAGTQAPVIGVPNYFGLQRFGSRRPVTHRVGHHILAEDWEQAVLTYLTASSEDEPEESRQAREELASTRSWTSALDEFPQRLRYERAMLHVLADDGSFEDALAALPTNLQQMFVHAVQSEIFNRIVSRRLATGLSFAEPVPGDVVCFTTEHDTIAVPDIDRIHRVTESNQSVVARHCRQSRAYVTAPLVGTDTSLADGEPGQIERTVLDEMGIAKSDFAGSEPYDSTGTRRAILVTTSVTIDVLDTGVDFEFALPKGSYATVLLREYLQARPEQY